ASQWFGTADKNGFPYRSWMKNQGIAAHQFQGKPIIGIGNTWSELTPCTAHFRQSAEHVKRGVSEAGGWPVEFPVFSNGESNLRPTAMFTRNLASMDVEAAIRGNHIDGVVTLTGCDKTTPALLTGAARCDSPAIVATGGPLLRRTP
ncbi:dihydroxy-acid dehydratase, partial [Pseudomonas syringae]